METLTPPAFGPPDADFEDIADAPDAAFDEAGDELETPDADEPDDRA
jgi:hypothetical protein